MNAQNKTDAFEPIIRGVAQSGVRMANERAVLSLIGGVPGVSNADVARRTGLGPQTTARILLDLEERGLIERGEVLRGKRGQPATPYWLNPHGAFAFGVEIGWSHLEIVLKPMVGDPMARIRLPHDFLDPHTVLERIAAEIRAMQAQLTETQRERLNVIGIAMPGFLPQMAELLAESSERASAWDRIDIAARLAASTGLEVVGFNDGSAATWTHIVAAPVPRPPGFASFQIGTFIAGGVISEGAVWHGPSGHGADLGSIMVTDFAGKTTPLHCVSSLFALQGRLKEAGIPASGEPDSWDIGAIGPVFEAWLDEAGFALAQAAISASAMMDIDLFIVDGVLPGEGLARLTEQVRLHLARLPKPSRGLPEIVRGNFGATAPALGAAQLTLFDRYFSRGWTLFRS